ncbi:hypothetical protein, partial [Klebsiella quasipneumoniae]|uniref:hypothetical protein n=1 Tax=Klebsiella quasipneumoniae TaxID=1463165 RepID=UPI002730D208
ALREGLSVLLEAGAARITGVDESASLACVPAVCAGEPLGVLLLVFAEPPRLSQGILRALSLIATALWLALMHEQLLADEP